MYSLKLKKPFFFKKIDVFAFLGVVFADFALSKPLFMAICGLFKRFFGAL